MVKNLINIRVRYWDCSNDEISCLFSGKSSLTSLFSDTGLHHISRDELLTDVDLALCMPDSPRLPGFSPVKERKIAFGCRCENWQELLPVFLLEIHAGPDDRARVLRLWQTRLWGSAPTATSHSTCTSPNGDGGPCLQESGIPMSVTRSPRSLHTGRDPARHPRPPLPPYSLRRRSMEEAWTSSGTEPEGSLATLRARDDQNQGPERRCKIAAINSAITSTNGKRPAEVGWGVSCASICMAWPALTVKVDV